MPLRSGHDARAARIARSWRGLRDSAALVVFAGDAPDGRLTTDR
jgi:hypothetical protein